MFATWHIRADDDDYQKDIYGIGIYEELFCFKVFHGGKFTDFPNRVYEGGEIVQFDFIWSTYTKWSHIFKLEVFVMVK
ncbi:hypothetical protein HanPSC8_Chr16g0695401 [Helianthus annuus]|nr:hypothetical protein HanPSC8_Chr16g0695401 [Helianthus annuus]